ncbi:MAG: tetratricopeptide repeat protein [Bacteroidia bacterium]|nr:tetratricopeptide repeat protein [Bacteroidia bacterium]
MLPTAAVTVDSLQALGKIFYEQGAYYQALEHQLTAHEILAKTGDPLRLAKSLNDLGWTCYYIKQADRALMYYNEALAIYRQVNNPREAARTLGHIGHIFEKKQQYEEALTYQNEAFAVYQQLNDTLGMAEILENIGSVYEDQSQYEAAFDCFFQATQLNEFSPNPHALISNYNNLGDIYQKTGRFKKSLEYTRKALELAKKQQDKYQISSALRDMSETLHLLGDDVQAYQVLDEGRKLYEEIYSEEMATRIALMQTLFETERMAAKIQALEKDQKINRIIRTTTFLGLLLVLLLGVLIIHSQRLRFQKNKEIYEAQQRLFQAEIQNRELNEKNLQHELEAKSKSLTTHALHIIQKNRILEQLKAGINDVLKSKKTATIKEQLKALTDLVNYSFNRDEEWQDFRQMFEQVHLSFFQKLQTDFPDLSPADLRLCALIRLNMNSEDIATVLGISTNSLRISRYRLKKKLGLEASDSLTQFIHQV